MNDMPEWIKQHNAANKARLEEDEARNQESAETATRVAKAAPDVWQRFIKRLKHNADSLQKIEDESISGSATFIGPTGDERSCQVNTIRQQRGGPSLGRATFHFDGGNAIRLTTDSGPEVLLRMTAPFDVVGILADATHYSPENFADLVVQRLIADQVIAGSS